MVKSVLGKQFNYIVVLIVFSAFLITIYCLGSSDQMYLSTNIKIIMSFHMILTCYSMYKGFKNFRFIEIHDCEISFKNLFTKISTTYNFNDLDGFRNELYSRNNTIYLVKDGKEVESFSKIYYKNFIELAEALRPLEYLGQKPYTLIGAIKNLFK